MLIPDTYNCFLETKTKMKPHFSFEFWFRHHEMVSNHQYEDENPQEIGKEAEVLIIKHL